MQSHNHMWVSWGLGDVSWLVGGQLVAWVTGWVGGWVGKWVSG